MNLKAEITTVLISRGRKPATYASPIRSSVCRPLETLGELIHRVQDALVGRINGYSCAITPHNLVPNSTAAIVLDGAVILRAADHQVWLRHRVGDVVKLDVRNSITNKTPSLGAIGRPINAAVIERINDVRRQGIRRKRVMVDVRTVPLREARATVKVRPRPRVPVQNVAISNNPSRVRGSIGRARALFDEVSPTVCLVSMGFPRPVNACCGTELNAI